MPELLKLLPEGDTFLKIPVAPWVFMDGDINSPKVDSALLDLAEKMHETRKHHKAIGLAANQVGSSVRMFVMGQDFAEYTCINPEVLAVCPTTEKSNEGCLSFPGLVLSVERPVEIQVAYYDLTGERIVCRFADMLARCFLHELDHLNGITFDTRVSKLRLDMAKKKRMKNV